MKYFILFCLLSNTCIAQNDLKMDALDRYEIKKSDTLYRFYAVVPPKNFRYKIDRNYHSYVQDSIIVTRGAVAGKVMHGAYTLYYPDKNLMEQGNFKYGLKTGEWKTWFPGGELKQLTNWKDGKVVEKKKKLKKPSNDTHAENKTSSGQ